MGNCACDNASREEMDFTPVADKRSQKSLYDRLGGAPAIEAVVEGMYVKIFNDPELSDFFRKTDKDKQKAMQRAFLTQAT